MHWLTTTQANHDRRRYGGIGHLWQGRFEPSAIQHDDHLLTVIRHVERNPVRAEPRRQRRGLGLLVLGLSPDRWWDAGLVPRSGASPCELARTGESTVDGRRTDGRATVGEAWHTVWIEPLDRNHRQNPRARIHAAPRGRPARSSRSPGQQVTIIKPDDRPKLVACLQNSPCPLFLRSSLNPAIHNSSPAQFSIERKAQDHFLNGFRVDRVLSPHGVASRSVLFRQLCLPRSADHPRSSPVRSHSCPIQAAV